MVTIKGSIMAPAFSVLSVNGGAAALNQSLSSSNREDFIFWYCLLDFLLTFFCTDCEIIGNYFSIFVSKFNPKESLGASYAVHYLLYFGNL